MYSKAVREVPTLTALGGFLRTSFVLGDAVWILRNASLFCFTTNQYQCHFKVVH
jgi:hypothetical protein